jgi:hypothetical protein
MLLSQFGEGDGRESKVWVWDKQSGDVRRATAASVAYQNDLYTIPKEHIESLDPAEVENLPPELRGEYAVEAMFGMMEGSLANIIAVLKATLTVPPEGSDALTELLTAMTLFDMRTPARMEESRQMMEAVMNMIAEMNFPDLTNEQRVSLPFKTNRPQLLASVLQHLPELVEILRGRRWSLQYTTARDYILTDYPVQYVFARPPKQRWDIPAPAVENTIAMFPLTKDILLMGEYELPSGVRLGDSRWVGFHNTNALGHAERYLFTFADDFVMLSNERGLPAYASVYNSDERLFTMTPALFKQEVEAGRIAKPQRMTINGVAPEDYRLNEPMKPSTGFNPATSTQLLLKHTLLDEDGNEHEFPTRDDSE